MRRKTWLFLLAVGGLAANAEAAAWQDTHKAFRVGFLSTNGAAYDIKKLEPFRAYLQNAVGMPVELVPAVSYTALIDAEATDRVQYAVHSATSFVTTVARCQCVEPVGVPAAFDGAKGFYAIVLARADSDVRGPKDAVGKTLAVTGEDSIAGRLVPLKYLARAGVDLTSRAGSLVTVADPAAAVAALQSKTADLAVAWSSMTGDVAAGYDFGVLNTLVKAGTLSMDSVRVVWQSPLIPFGPHAVRSDVPDDIKGRLKAALSTMSATAPAALDAIDRSAIGGGGFADVATADYAVIADLIGVNLTQPAGISTTAPASPAPPVPEAPAVAPPVAAPAPGSAGPVAP